MSETSAYRSWNGRRLKPKKKKRKSHCAANAEQYRELCSAMHVQQHVSVQRGGREEERVVRIALLCLLQTRAQCSQLGGWGGANCYGR